MADIKFNTEISSDNADRIITIVQSLSERASEMEEEISALEGEGLTATVQLDDTNRRVTIDTTN
jgi:hypothetical protein